MRTTTPLFRLAAVAAAIGLSACGGGGGSGDDDDEEPPAAPLSVSGTAADGAAIAGAPVEVKCATGSGSGTTGNDGSYTVEIDAARAPCVVELTDGSTALHSMVKAGSTGSATANVTPLTELLTAQVAGGDAAGLFDDFDAAARAQLSAANIADARADLEAGLDGTVDLAGFDPIETPFAAGDANDQKLDELADALAAAQTTLPELAAVLVANPGSAAPVRTALLPSAAECKSLKSANVRFVSPFGFSRGVVDAVNLTFTPEGGSAVPLTDAGDCTFTQTDGTFAAVSPSSVGVNRFPLPDSGGAFSMSFGFPEQEIALSELTGTWNYVAYLRDPSDAMDTFTPAHGRFTIGANGVQAAPAEDCIELSTCGPGRTDGVFTVNPEGGFNFGAPGGATEFRNFAYRAPSGTLMLFAFADSPDETGLLVATKQVRSGLPVVGLVTAFNQVSLGPTGTAGAVTSGSSTIASVDGGGNGSFVVTREDGHMQTFLLNTPREGMRHRQAGSSQATGGATVPFSAVVQLRPPEVGFSMSVSSDPAQNFFSASVDEPAAP